MLVPHGVTLPDDSRCYLQDTVGGTIGAFEHTGATFRLSAVVEVLYAYAVKDRRRRPTLNSRSSRGR